MRDLLAVSLDRLGTETAFETLARAKALEATGRRIIHLEIGEPDFPTPPHVVEAAAKAFRDGAAQAAARAADERHPPLEPEVHRRR